MATLKGTWRFNDVFSVANIAELGADIIFTSNETEYTLIGVLSNGTDCVMLYSTTDDIDDAVCAYSSVLSDGNVPITNIGWQSEAYKTITITDGQEVSDEFYAWLTANAARIDEEETPIATITYKGETLETLNGGEYVTLHTKGQMMEDDIRVEVAAIAISEDSPLPIEIATEEEMNALLDTAEVGSVYKYADDAEESGIYENGALYMVEESE